MLEYLKLTDVGPAPEMEIDFAPRLTVVTGDNGLGKTFLLDLAWWALTRTWARNPAFVSPDAEDPTIECRYGSERGTYPHTSHFDRRRQTWSGTAGLLDDFDSSPVHHDLLAPVERPPAAGIAIFAQLDGAFATWDPARNAWWEGHQREDAYLFAAREVWDGLPTPVGGVLCNGLIRDWASWQRERGDAFAQLAAVLRALSPSAEEPLAPGKLMRIALDDVRDHPTVATPYGQDVPLVFASSGTRRIVALAYLLVWTWHEHLRACELIGLEPATEVTFLVDEIEAHLHPQWQRRIVPALLDVMKALTGHGEVSVQLIVSTHSPLVLTSIEPDFDEDRDSIFHLELRDGAVHLDPVAWAKQGDVTGWLVSEVFGLEQARSIEAERAIESAEAWMRGDHDGLPAYLDSQDKIDAELHRVLAGHDPFWPRWIVHVENATEARP